MAKKPKPVAKPEPKWVEPELWYEGDKVILRLTHKDGTQEEYAILDGADYDSPTQATYLQDRFNEVVGAFMEDHPDDSDE